MALKVKDICFLATILGLAIALIVQYNSSSESLNEMKRDLLSTEEKLSKSKDESEKCENSLKKIQKKLEDENTRLRNEVKEKTTSVEVLGDEHEKKINNLQKKVKSLQEENTKLDGDLKKAREQLDETKESLKEAKGETTGEQRKALQLKDNINFLENQVDELKDKLAAALKAAANSKTEAPKDGAIDEKKPVADEEDEDDELANRGIEQPLHDESPVEGGDKVEGEEAAGKTTKKDTVYNPNGEEEEGVKGEEEKPATTKIGKKAPTDEDADDATAGKTAAGAEDEEGKGVATEYAGDRENQDVNLDGEKPAGGKADDASVVGGAGGSGATTGGKATTGGAATGKAGAATGGATSGKATTGGGKATTGGAPTSGLGTTGVLGGKTTGGSGKLGGGAAAVSGDGAVTTSGKPWGGSGGSGSAPGLEPVTKGHSSGDGHHHAAHEGPGGFGGPADGTTGKSIEEFPPELRFRKPGGGSGSLGEDHHDGEGAVTTTGRIGGGSAGAGSRGNVEPGAAVTTGGAGKM